MRKKTIPNEIASLVKTSLGDDANIVLDSVKEVLELEYTLPPLVDNGMTYGDWSMFSIDKKNANDYRPQSALSIEIIEQMLKSAPVRFALEMKRAQIVSVFRNERSWKVTCNDEELQDIVTYNLQQILPKMALDFSFSSLAYGVSFQELVWERKNKYELGMEEENSGNSVKFVVAKIPNSVNPASVDRILRTKTGHFDGFVQKPRWLMGNEEIVVPSEASLIIPYEEKFRNLWGESLLKPMYPIWYWYEIVLRAMVKYMERTGTPVAMVKAPARATIIEPVTKKRIDGITWGMQIASNVSRSNAVVIPSDKDEQGNPLWELSYLNSSERSQPFLDILELLTQMILRAGLSADRALSQSSGGVGSYSIGEVHKEATALHNELILTQWVHYLNTYFLPLYSLYNRGQNGPSIHIETQGLDPTDRTNLTTLLGVAQNMESFKEIGYRIDWESLLTVNNIPLKSKEDAEAEKGKLEEESLKKQEDMLGMQSKFAAPSPTKAADGSLKANPASKAPEKKVEPTKKLEEQIDLFNPYHEKSSGRFASKNGGASGGSFSKLSINSDFQSQERTRLANQIGKLDSFNQMVDVAGKLLPPALPFVIAYKTGGVVGNAVGINKKATLEQRLNDIDLLPPEVYKKKYSGLNEYTKDLFNDPAEVLSRNYDSRSGKLMFASEISSDIAFRIGVRALAGGALMGIGGIATAYLADYFDVDVPDWGLKLGGLGTAIVGSKVLSSILDNGQTVIQNALIDRYSPNDQYHTKLATVETLVGKAKTGMKIDMAQGAFNTAEFVLSPMDDLMAFAISSAYEYASFKAIGLEDSEHIDSLQLELPNKQSWEKNPMSAIAFMAHIYPHVVEHVMYDDPVPFVLPIYNERLIQFGFVPDKNYQSMMLSKQGCDVLAKNWKLGALPNIQDLSWGNLEQELLDTVDEKKKEQLELTNPYHDKLGRFASASQKAMSSKINEAREFVREHKKEIAIGVGVTVAVVATTAAVVTLSRRNYKSKQTDYKNESGITLLSDAIAEPILNNGVNQYKALPDNKSSNLDSPYQFNYKREADDYNRIIGSEHSAESEHIKLKTTIRNYDGSLSDEDISRLHSAAIETVNIMNNMGVSNDHNKHILWTGDSKGTYAEPWINLASLDNSIRNDVLTENGNKSYATNVIAHELFHNRKTFNQDYDTEYFRKNPDKKIMPIEEGLANIFSASAQSIYQVHHGETNRVNDSFWRNVNTSYSPYSMDVFAAAALKKREEKSGDSVWKIVQNWYNDVNSNYEIEKLVSNVYKSRSERGILTREERAIRDINKEYESTKEGLSLANPYHDKLGRFAAKQGHTSGFFNYNNGGVIVASDEDVAKVERIMGGVKEKTQSRLSHELNDFTTHVCKTPEEVTSLIGGDKVNPDNFWGLYYHDGTERRLIITPRGVSELKDEPSMIDRVFTHEIIHAVKRNSKDGNPRCNTYARDYIEEGLTEMMTFNMVGTQHLDTTPYGRNMEIVASYVYKQSNGDTEKAWKMVSDMHYKMGNNSMSDKMQRETGSVFSRYNPNDLQIMLNNPVYKLNIAKEAFAAHEIQVKIINKTYFNEEEPFGNLVSEKE